MLEILQNINNYFYAFKEYDHYKIENSNIKVKGNYSPGQYILIKDSMLNDGLYKVVDFKNNTITIESTLELTEGDKSFVQEIQNEEFRGYICSLSIPQQLIQICNKIKEYNSKNKKTNLISESFSNYSYTKMQDSEGNIATWQDVFKKDLRPYRKMYDGFNFVKEVR